MATRRILFRFFDAPTPGEDVILWGGGRLTLLAGGCLGSVGAAQGAAYARALGAAYLPETDALSGAGSSAARVASAAGSTEALLGAGSSSVLAGGAPLESGYLPFGASGWMYVSIPDPGAVYTLIVKFADLPLTTATWPVAMMIGDANMWPRNLVAYSQMQDASPDRHRTLGLRASDGAIEWGNTSSDQAAGAQVHVLARDNSANTAHARVIRSSDQSVHWSIDAAAVGDRTPIVIAIGELVNAAFVGQGFLGAQPKVVAVILLRVVPINADSQAYSAPACRNAYDVWGGDEVIGYWPMSQAVGSAVPNQVAGGSAGILTGVTSAAFVRTVGDGVPYLPLTSAGRAGGLVEAEAVAQAGAASAARGAGKVDVDAGGLAGESSAASVSGELGDVSASAPLTSVDASRGAGPVAAEAGGLGLNESSASGAGRAALAGGVYLPIGDAAVSWGAGSIGYAQAGGYAELADGMWGAALVELEAAGLIDLETAKIRLSLEVATSVGLAMTVSGAGVELTTEVVASPSLELTMTVASAGVEMATEVATGIELEIEI